MIPYPVTPNCDRLTEQLFGLKDYEAVKPLVIIFALRPLELSGTGTALALTVVASFISLDQFSSYEMTPVSRDV